MKSMNGFKICALFLCAAIPFSGNVFADDLPDAPSANISNADSLTKAMAQKVCASLPSKDCEITSSSSADHSASDGEATNHFYASVMMSWEHAFGSSEWEKKIFYNGAYRLVDKATGRQYELFRFDNEQSVPINEPADVGDKTVYDSDYINDIKVYQTQQKDKNGKYPSVDDDLTQRSKFIGETIDEMDYGRHLHYVLAIPIGWDRAYQKQVGKVTVTNDNEVAVGGLAYAGIFQDDGTSTGHFGVNLVRTVDSVSFSFAKGANSFTVTPAEITNDCAVFRQGVNCEWEASATFQYQNDKTGIGIGGELAHRSGLTAYEDQTQDESIFRVGVSIDPVKAASGIGRVVKKIVKGKSQVDAVN
jgi:hypothetical protein